MDEYNNLNLNNISSESKLLLYEEQQQKSHNLYPIPPISNDSSMLNKNYNIMYSSCQSVYSGKPSFANSYSTQYYTETMQWMSDHGQAGQTKPDDKSKIQYTNQMNVCPTMNTDFMSYRGNYTDSQWYYGSNYNTQNLTSCSQMDTVGSSNSCCRIQKEAQFPLQLRNYNFNNYTQDIHVPESTFCPGMYDKKKDKSDGDSDIIVEDSDEELSEMSEECDIDDSIIYICIICNITSKSSELVFFHIGDETLLTSTTQSPVVQKLKEITSGSFPKSIVDHICNMCLSLVNTVDCLQVKLTDSKKRIIDMYEKTCSILQDVASKINDTVNKTFDIPEIPDKMVPPPTSVEEEPINNKRICKICNKYFCTTDIHKHKQLHANHINFKCTLCFRSFTMKRLLDNHLKRHNEERDFLCDRCGKCFIKHNSLNIHLRRHYNEFTFFCDICKKGFVNNSALRTHRRTHTPTKPFDCSICKKKFRTNSNLQEHMRYCSGNLIFECDQCDKKFAAVAKLNDHIKLRHEKKFKISCNECGVGFTKESNYKAHMTSHSNHRDFTCTECGKAYKTRGNLNHHMKVHEEHFTHKCEECGKGFQRKEELVIHKTIHTGVKAFVCSVCNKKFGAHKHLKAHLRIHNGTVKKASCPVCNKQLVHGLTEHMRLHTGVRPFKCSTCTMSFISKCALQKHVKRKHSIFP